MTSRADVRPERIIAKAEAATGFTDWGEPEFREALDVLAASASEAPVSEAAAATMEARFVDPAIKRLKLYADRARYPEIARQKIVAPLILMGLPRSGTTILHALLAQDPGARSPLNWELADPSPPPRAETFHSDPRIAAAQARVEMLDPQFRAMHAMGAELPDECNSFMTWGFQSPNFGASVDLNAYETWLTTQCDAKGAYALHRHVLQHLQAFAPRQWWTLKAPPHLFWLDRMFETYPDARVVVTHRDPAAVLPSNASLISFLRKGAGEVDPKKVGRHEVAKWKGGLERTMAYRASGKHKAQIFDSQYVDYMRDPMGAVAAIYDHFGMTLTAEAETRMRAFLAENKQDKHGAHHYTAEEFGLDAASLHREFADYIQTYNVPIKAEA